MPLTNIAQVEHKSFDYIVVGTLYFSCWTTGLPCLSSIGGGVRACVHIIQSVIESSFRLLVSP